jgi:hypothetical protein
MRSILLAGERSACTSGTARNGFVGNRQRGPLPMADMSIGWRLTFQLVRARLVHGSGRRHDRMTGQLVVINLMAPRRAIAWIATAMRIAPMARHHPAALRPCGFRIRRPRPR